MTDQKFHKLKDALRGTLQRVTAHTSDAELDDEAGRLLELFGDDGMSLEEAKKIVDGFRAEIIAKSKVMAPRSSSPRTALLSKLAGLHAATTGAVSEMMQERILTQSGIGEMATLGSMDQAYETIDKVAAKMGMTQAELRQTWEQQLEAISNWARAVAKQWVSPPLGQLVTANNTETFAMAVTHFINTLAEFELTRDESDEERAGLWEALGNHVLEFGRIRERAQAFLRRVDHDDQFQRFAYPWRESSYARLEISHKLAAALCLTDTHGVDVHAPWQACSIVVPDNLFEEIEGVGRVARLWCVGTEIVFAVLSDGDIVIPPRSDHPDQRVRDFQRLIDNLVHGAFLALENPEEHRKKGFMAPSSKKSNRSGPPDMARAMYMLSTPVSIDLRETLREFQGGKRAGGGAPKVQFLVRGHWRQQPVGARDVHPIRRKNIWISPFWKGPEDTRVLLRSHKLKEEK